VDYLIGIFSGDAESAPTSAEQIIIIEHKDRLPTQIDGLLQTPHVKVTEFTRDKEHGIYGILGWCLSI
jgi:hypothetical protein